MDRDNVKCVQLICFLYTLLGLLFMLVGVVYVYLSDGSASYDLFVQQFNIK